MKSQEIVTKAVIGKGKRKSSKKYILNLANIDNILGCWVINHKFKGILNNDKVIINGIYDINVWYSYDNNTKTNVNIESIKYEDILNIRLKNNNKLNSESSVVVRCLNQPSVIDVINKDNKIELEIEKEMSVEVIGDTLVSVNISDDEIVYDEIEDFEEINEDYL